MSKIKKRPGPNIGGLLLPGAGRGAGPHKDRIDRDHKRNRKTFNADFQRGRYN